MKLFIMGLTFGVLAILIPVLIIIEDKPTNITIPQPSITQPIEQHGMLMYDPNRDCWVEDKE